MGWLTWALGSWRREAKRFHRRLVAQGSRLFAVELAQDQLETRLEELEKLVADLLLGDAPAKGRETHEGYRETGVELCRHPMSRLVAGKGCGACGMPFGEIGSVWCDAPDSIRSGYDAALAKLEADMGASESEMLKLSPEERSRRWAETLAAWAPKVDGEQSFFGVREPRPEPLRVPVVEYCHGCGYCHAGGCGEVRS